MYDKQALISLIKETALQFGDFTLASGKKATFYLDCRKVTLDSRGAKLIGAGDDEVVAGESTSVNLFKCLAAALNGAFGKRRLEGTVSLTRAPFLSAGLLALANE